MSGQYPPPTRRDRLKPVELIVFSAILGVFTLLVVMFTTREFELAAIFGGVAFIVALVVLAMLGLGSHPNARDLIDLEEQDREDDEKKHGH
jgi:hypothetical protein